MTTKETKTELMKAASDLIAQSKTMSANDPERYLVEETGHELQKIASEIDDNATEEELQAMVTIEKAAAVRVFPSAYGPATKRFVETMGSGAAGLTLGIGALAALKAAKKMGDMVDYSRYRSALDTAVKGNSTLEEVPEDRIRNIGETIHRFAPMASQDPNLLGAVLNNYAITDGAVDAQTIKMLTEIEDRMNKRHQSSVSGLKV